MLQPAKPVEGVRHLIAIASGKGGVGKSTVAVNLALALSQCKRRVGLLDADIYGPSLPLMLGAQVKPEITGAKKMQPVLLHGLQAMSIGWLVEATSAMIWRGPMATTALQQLMYDTLWDQLDELVIDLPPGTGDIHLTLAQKMPVTAAVIVTTPQELALADARRALEMFRRVKIPVIGIVENMAEHLCSHCGHSEMIFGEGGGEALAAAYEVPLLGSLPLSGRIRESMDQGCPMVVKDPEGAFAAKYRAIAEQVIAYLEKPQMDGFPEIIIRND